MRGELFYVLTAHLESTKDYSDARKTQLKQCFKYLLGREEDRTVVFAGDLNLRDKEVGNKFAVMPKKGIKAAVFQMLKK